MTTEEAAITPSELTAVICPGNGATEVHTTLVSMDELADDAAALAAELELRLAVPAALLVLLAELLGFVVVVEVPLPPLHAAESAAINTTIIMRIGI